MLGELKKISKEFTAIEIQNNAFIFLKTGI